MPCPFFEPQQRTAAPKFTHARLPLVEEYDGLCHAGEHPERAPGALRFACCNHGYSSTTCDRFPAGQQPSAFRYTVIAEAQDSLLVLCVEERDHIPASRGTVRFDLHRAGLAENEFTHIVRAQALAFSRSYQDRFLRK